MLHKTRLVLENVRSAVGDIKPERLAIKNYFAEYILVIFYSEMEEKLKGIFYEKLKNGSNEETASFIEQNMGHIMKRLKKSEICDMLRHFGRKRCNYFNELLEEAIFQKYQNYIQNRHAVAHAAHSINTSLEELEEIADVGEKILEWLSLALNR